MKSRMNQLFDEQKSVHVLYAYNGMKHYFEQVVEFIHNGILAGEYVILIENARLYRIIEKELSKRLTKEQMKFCHWINSFDFYFSSGSYHPPAIEKYFQKTVHPYIEKNISFRSWAHVEWRSMEEPLHLIEDFERIADKAVNVVSFPLICAYEGERMPDYLRNILLETHPYVLVEDDLIDSEQYHTSTR
nr:MEDS domain-containing protein [Bacillus tianshenii]